MATYLFNGDVADRGPSSLEIFFVIFGFMCARPGSVFLNRGNHEDKFLNERYGFHAECTGKYGKRDGGRIFDTLTRLYTLLPLATVLAKQIFVVHGGLPRREHALALLRAANSLRPKALPFHCEDAHEQVMMDFLWSDPSETPGITHSVRGSQQIRFGPDITRRFLEENSLRLVVRSHEVPPNRDGCQVMHQGQLVTVFSASNYGNQQNRGGVLIFTQTDRGLQQEMAPFWAPLDPQEFRVLQELLQASLGQGPKPETVRPQLQAQEQSAQQRVCQEDPRQERLRQWMYREAACKIVEQKPALYNYFFHRDRSKDGFIEVQHWARGCHQILGDLGWDALREILAVEEMDSNFVDYVTFLRRFRVNLEGNEVSERWAEDLVNRVFKRLGQSDWPLEQILRTFDRDGDGTVTAAELRDALADLNVGITRAQAASLLQTMHQHTKRSASSRGGICITSFLSIFEMAFHPMASRDVPAWVTCALREFGKTIWKAGEEGAMSFFKASDVDQNGRLSLPELATALEQLATTYGLKDVVGSRTEFLELARHVDLSGEGSVNYAEFVAGFMPVGLLHGSTFQLDVMESICGSDCEMFGDCLNVELWDPALDQLS
ncbi:unnamed protein product [Effrenium voratum]|uniref:Serine/threonine-protein phosphatase n=1 Tax=Effrenium voratum TaxID=2562239 RepID=A0AA36JG38_9DINO|nr:unnamed protein product [Effrenium voratum]